MTVRIIRDMPLTFELDGSALQDRRDAFYYHPKYLDAIERLREAPWEVRTIKDISDSVKDGPGGWDFHVSDYTTEGIPMLRVLNVREEGIALDNLVFIGEETHDKLRRSSVIPGDVLLSMRGTIGISTVYPETMEEANINAALARIRLKPEINPYYVAVFLNSKLGRAQTERGGFRAVQNDLNLPIINSIEIPLPPKQVQDHIAGIMLQAYTNKIEKMETAKILKESSRNLILQMLGIEETNGGQRNSYWVDPVDLQERRDPAFYHPKYSMLTKSLTKLPFEIKVLGELVDEIVSGQRPKGGVKYIETGIPSLGGEHITADGGFDFTKLRYIPKEFHEKQIRSWVKPLDILMVKDGATTGKVAVVSEGFRFEKCNINEHLLKIRIKQEYDPSYIFLYLWSDLGQKQIQRFKSGAAQKGITREAVQNMKIIVPSREVQGRIVELASKKRQEAKKLEKEAQEIVDEAKQKVEDIIITGLVKY